MDSAASYSPIEGNGSKKTLAEMKALNLPHLTVESFIKISKKEEGTSDEEYEKDKAAFIAVVDPYLRQFLPYAKKCACCDAELFGLFGMGGSFEWGLQRGEGRCINCGWPVRVYHRATDPVSGEEYFDLTMPLQYHPDSLEEAKKGEGSRP